MISKKQIQTLQIARRKIGLTDDQWHDLLGSHGLTSSTDANFDNAKFRQVLQSLEKFGFTFKPKSTNRDGFATAAQIERIQSDWRSHPNVLDPSDYSLGEFMFRITGVRKFDMLARKFVPKLIAAIKNIKPLKGR